MHVPVQKLRGTTCADKIHGSREANASHNVSGFPHFRCSLVTPLHPGAQLIIKGSSSDTWLSCINSLLIVMGTWFAFIIFPCVASVQH